MANWDAVAVKAQLRLTAQRLGQLQERQDSQGQVTRRDIATLLQQGNIGPARTKAQVLIHDDSVGDLLEALEMHVGLIVEHFGELDNPGTLSATLEEAACSVVFAAPHTESKDLNIVRELLLQRLGPDFARSATSNLHNRVSRRVARALSPPAPSAANLDDYMLKIAKSHGINWAPEPRRNDLTNAMIQILDPATAPTVDIVQLRQLCSLGIPDKPSWIRPRAWKIFFGILPVLKASWDVELHKHRESYYDLIRRLLSPMSNLPPPTSPLNPPDMSLQSVFESLARVPYSLFCGLQDEPEVSSSVLDPTAPDDIRIACAANLDLRLQQIQESQISDDTNGGTPEIRLERHASDAKNFAGRRRGAPTTLLSAKDYTFAGAHTKHTSALIRLLYLHSCLNPLNHSPHIPSLLIPMYTALLQETEPKDTAHVEADTFWLFEAMIGEFSELEDGDGGKIWMKKLSERLAWADQELSVNLHGKGLDPALPHYSYRWLAPLLTQTLPLSSVYLVWDALFCCPMRERDSNAKLEHLLDICTSMLTRARAPLFRLGKSGRRSPSLWAEEQAKRPPPSPLRPWELSDAFTEGTSLLQMYPVEAAGGIDSILQAAADLAHRRVEEAKSPKGGNNIGLGARLKVSMWKGLTKQLSASVDDEAEPSDEEDPHDDGNETETQLPSTPGLTSRLANTVWRGFTNQSVEALPSPVAPLSPVSSPSGSPSPSASPYTAPIELAPEPVPTPSSPPNIWGYAEKLKDSNAAASLAKVSSNWRALAMDAWGSRKRGMSLTAESQSPASTTSELPANSASWAPWTRSPMSEPEDRRRTLPGFDHYTPPPRPAHFRAPRDSFIPGPRPSAPDSPDINPSPNGGLVHRTKASLASMAGLAPAPPVPSKSGPRPLMLSSSQLMTAPKANISRSATSTPTPYQGEWADVMRSKSHIRDSLSSVSSLSPLDALGRPSWMAGGNRSDADSDSTRGSRLVPINRRSISPMAPSARIAAAAAARGRPRSPESSGTSSDRVPNPRIAPSPSPSDKGWGRVDLPDSPQTPITNTSSAIDVQISNGDHSRFGSVSLNDPGVTALEFSMPPKKVMRKRTPTQPVSVEEDTSDSSAPGPSVSSFSSRMRSKRYPQRPSNLRLGTGSRSNTLEDKTPSPNTLVPDWPEITGATPTAAMFNNNSDISSVSPTTPLSAGRVRKVSTGSHESRTRKISAEGPPRIRKVSTERRKRESVANEGDDEGYDDLLSAYESEE